MNTKMLLQVLLTLGCLALVIGTIGAFAHTTFMIPPQGWWRGAIAFWVLLIAVRTVYPGQAT